MGLHYRNGALARSVSAREGAAAYRLTATAGQVVEPRLNAELLAPQS